MYRHTQPSVSAGACRRRTESIVSDGLPREEGGGRGEEGVAEMLIHRGGRREKTLHLMGREEGEGRRECLLIPRGGRGRESEGESEGAGGGL